MSGRGDRSIRFGPGCVIVFAEGAGFRFSITRSKHERARISEDAFADPAAAREAAWLVVEGVLNKRERAR
jgi:hypothetical protein